MQLDEISTDALEAATLAAIGDLEEATNPEVERLVGNRLGLSESERQLRTPDGTMTVLGYRIAWRRTALKRNGLIRNVRTGVWKLIDEDRRDPEPVPPDTELPAVPVSATMPPLFPWHRLSVSELLVAERQAMRELQRRQIIRGKGALVGDLAEWLVAGAYDGILAPPVQRAHDVICADGTRIQVKARVVAVNGGAGDLQLGTIHHHDYDTLIGVLFEAEDLRVREALEIPRALVERHGARRDGGFTVHLNPAVITRLINDGAIRIVDRLERVAEDLAGPPAADPMGTSIAESSLLEDDGHRPRR